MTDGGRLKEKKKGDECCM